MAKLNHIPVVFDQEHHTYTNTETGEQYKGITSTLIHRVFPDKYAGIPEHILKAAAERGSFVHEEIELAESIGIEPSSQEAQNYLKIKDANNLKCITTEYTVSDLEHYATNIDAVYEGEGEDTVNIVDFKTTSKLDKESVSWQLSICAHFLELNNQAVRVGKLYAIWLRGDIAEMVEVQRKSYDEIVRLITADINDEPYEAESTFPEYFRELEWTLESLTKRIKELTAEADSLKAELLESMEKHGDKSFDTGSMLVTYVAPSKRSSFDSTRFKKEHADLYGEYQKESATKASLKITLR